MEPSSKHNYKKIVIYSILTFVVMLMIFIFSAQNKDLSEDVSNSFLMTVLGQVLEKILPPLTGDGFEVDIREYAHMIEFGCLGISLSLLMRELILKRRWLVYLAAEAGCFLYACSDEFHQTFVPGRFGTFADVGVDAVGFTTGVLLVALVDIILSIIKRKRVAKRQGNKEKDKSDYTKR